QQKRAEREIEEAKSFLDALINAIPTPVLVKDEQHRFVAANAAFSVFFRRAPESILGKTDFHFFSAEDADFYQKTDDQALQGVAIEYERPYVVSGQPPRWMRVRKSVLTRPNGSRLVVLLMIDITEQHAALAQLSASEQRFRSLTQLSADWFWEQDAQLNFTFVSAQTANHDAMRLTDIIGATQLKPDLEWESEQARISYRTCIEARDSFKDVQLRDPITSRSISLNGEAVFDSEGKFQGYRGTATDITERRVSQQRIARLKDMYAAMSEANGVIIHSRNPSELFDAICRIAIESVHFMFVRIALLDAPSGPAHTAAEQGHLLQGGLAMSVDAAVEQRMAEHSIRTGMNSIYNDISIEPRLRSWRTQLADQGVRSLATLLLRGNGRVVGTLHLYSGQLGFFDEELVGLLEKLTMNLSFALDNFQRDDARQATQRALGESETRFRDFADAAGEYVWETDLEGRFTYVSSRVLSVWGYSDQELIGHAWEEMMPVNEAARVADWMRTHVAPDGSFRDLEHMIATRQGEIRWLLINAVCMFDASGKHMGRRGTGRDITERKNSEERINYLATRDPLTELPNRVLFNDRLEQGILAAQRTGQSLAVLFIDLDRFKTINDSLGHQVGDLLLKEVAVRMQASIRKGDTVSRLGGDEFVVTLEGLQHPDDAAQVAAKIIKSLSRSVEISSHTLNTSCSIGISIFPLDAQDNRTLMKNADTAMYHAKEKGRNNYQFFSSEMNVRAVERHNLETQLRQAVERQEFILHYQPQVDMRTGKVVGAEALLRWKHPERGLLGPSTFIHIAEETGLIEPIGQWALHTACQCARDWQTSGYAALRMAVNISSRQLMRPKEFARMVVQTLSSTGLDPHHLELEMTESLLVHNADDNIAFLRKLGQDGIRIAVDDFGTSYSSLSYLRQLPIDTLKIDRSFVRNIDVNSEDLAIIQAIVAMAHSLGLQVTAEGVDARGQLAALAGLGCDQYQGYLFSRPLPDVELAARFLAPRELEFEPVGFTARPASAATRPLI
ncbi:MAG: EAL domain-containing protein, partial [Betaproteobacteria bacterium]